MDEVRMLERDIVGMLNALPIPIVVLLPEECGYPGRYEWLCLEGRGVALSLDAAINQALHFLMGRLLGPDLSAVQL